MRPPSPSVPDPRPVGHDPLGGHRRKDRADSERSLLRLLARTAERDEAAFTRLFDVTRPRVSGLAFRILADAGAAEEAALDTYSAIWNQADRFDPRRGRPMTWILTIARSRALDLRRGRMRRAVVQAPVSPLPEVVAPTSDPHGHLEREECCKALRRALDSLPPEQRIAIETAYFSGLSHSEIAQQLGEPLGTVKSRIRGGLSSLRRKLART